VEPHPNVGALRLGRWVGGTFAGWTAGFFLAILFIVVVDSVGILQMQSPLALGMGVGVGLAQARLLGPMVGRRSRWVLSTALGLAAPFLVGDVSHLTGRPVPFNLAAYVVIGGLVVGIVQWRLLQRTTPHAAWWLVATPIGWLLASSTVLIADGRLPRIPGIVGALLFIGVVLGGGLLLGLCTAPAARRIVPSRVA
jgi:hypothetical protein